VLRSASSMAAVSRKERREERERPGGGGGWEEEDSGWLGLGEAGAAASLLGPGGPIRLGLVRFFFFFFNFLFLISKYIFK
jgi:hypothetical protein